MTYPEMRPETTPSGEEQIAQLEMKISELEEESDCPMCGGSGECVRCERGQLQAQVNKIRNSLNKK